MKNGLSNPCILDSSSNDSKEESSTSGPTTRKAWSDWCSNKIVKTNSLNNSGQDSNEENGKTYIHSHVYNTKIFYALFEFSIGF